MSRIPLHTNITAICLFFSIEFKKGLCLQVYLFSYFNLKLLKQILESSTYIS